MEQNDIEFLKDVFNNRFWQRGNSELIEGRVVHGYSGDEVVFRYRQDSNTWTISCLNKNSGGDRDISTYPIYEALNIRYDPDRFVREFIDHFNKCISQIISWLNTDIENAKEELLGWRTFLF